MALTIATGFVVDDAIVMIENIARYIEEGDPPLEAALKGAEQIGFTIISLTFSLIAVLIPLLFMGDVVGRLFREFAITLAVAILISAVVSLTLTPMMCARLLRHTPEERAGPLLPRERASVRPRDRALRRRCSTGCSTARRATLLVAVAHAGADGRALHRRAEGLLPGAGHRRDPGHLRSAAVGLVRRDGRAPAGAGARSSSKDPAVESLSSFIGVDGTNTTLNSGRMLINLKPHGAARRDAPRDDPPAAAAARRRRGHHALHAAGAGPDDRGPRQPHAVPVHARDRRTATSSPRGCRGSSTGCAQLPQLADVASDLQDQGLQAYVEIDRATASRLGITPAAIDNALYNAFGQRLSRRSSRRRTSTASCSR